MRTATYTATYTAPVPAVSIWIGRSFCALAALFLFVDGVIKLLQLAPAVESSTQLGYRAGVTLGLGILELACLAVYLLPRTAPLGAILLTGYLGGAVATNVRVGSPLFSVIFPLLLGALLWVGLTLRDRRLRALLLEHQEHIHTTPL